MATSHEIRNGLDSSESDIGAGQTTSRGESHYLANGFFGTNMYLTRKNQIQSSARCEGLQTRTWGRLRRYILAYSQDDHPSAPTRGRGDRRPTARAPRRENDIPTQRLG